MLPGFQSKLYDVVAGTTGEGANPGASAQGRWAEIANVEMEESHALPVLW